MAYKLKGLKTRFFNRKLRPASFKKGESRWNKSFKKKLDTRGSLGRYWKYFGIY